MPELLSDQDRIKQMLADGKLTAAEAEQLLEALGDMNDAEATLDAAEADIQEMVEQSKREVEEAEEVETSIVKQKEPKEPLDEELNWVSINMLFGDIDIRVDQSLTEPVADNNRGSFVKEGNVYRLKQGNTKKRKTQTDSLEDIAKNVGDMVSGFFSKTGDLSVRIPKGFAVEVSSKAGDVDVDGAAYLDAELLAGDLDASNIGGIRANMAAGDIDVSLKVKDGKNLIKLSAGDVDVDILPGSSVEIQGSVSMGDFRLRAPAHIEETIEIEDRMMGGAFTAKVAEGDALLVIEVSAGDLDVKVME